MSKIEWNPRPLWDLKDKSGITLNDLSKMTGISFPNVKRILSDGGAPSLATAVKLADFFAVPVDYILGRCSEEDYRRIIDNYESTFRDLRKDSYEGLIKFGHRKDIQIPPGYEAPWPYNFLEKVVQNPFDSVLTNDQIKGLGYVMSLLSEREAAVIQRYYRDGLCLTDTAKELHVSPQRVHQILRRAVRKLRHPSKLNYILNGYEYTVAVNTEIEEAARSTLEAQRERNERIREESYRRALGGEEEPFVLTLSLEELGLSIRAYNCLRRSKLYTVEDVVTLVDENGIEALTKIRNLGRGTAKEIIDTIRAKTGIDLEKLDTLEVDICEYLKSHKNNS